MKLYDRIFKPKKYELPNGKTVEERFTRLPLILLLLLVCTVISVRITGFNFEVLGRNGSKFFDILKAMFPPKTSYMPKIWQPLWDTIKTLNISDRNIEEVALSASNKNMLMCLTIM